MIAAITALVDFCRRFAAIVAGVFLILAVLGGMFAANHIRIDTDIDKLMSPKLAWRQHEAQMTREFPQNIDTLAIVIDGRTPDLADDAGAALAKKLAPRTDLFHSVKRESAGDFFQREGLLFLSKEEVQKTADQIIAAQPLLGTLAADPNLRGIFNALDFAALGVMQDMTKPEALDSTFNATADATEAALAGRYAPLSWQTLLSGRTPSSLELRRFVIAKPVLDYSELEPGARATDAVRQAATELGLTPDRGVTVRITGPVALSDSEFATLKSGASFSSALSLGLLLLWLILGLRSIKLVIAILITLLAGLSACGVFAVLAVGALNPISVAFAVLFIGIAVDFGIQFSLRYRDERFQHGDLADALRHTAKGIGGALAIAAAATAVGFLSFVPTDYTGVRDLGIIAGFGMVVAFFLNVTLLPALITLLRPRGERGEIGFAWAKPVERFLLIRRRPVLAVAGIVALAGLAVLPWLQFDFNPLHLQSTHEEAVSTLFDLMADTNTTPYTINVMTPNPEAAAAMSARLGKLPEVARAVSISSFVPSDQPDKLAILQDAQSLLGPTLSPAQTKPAPSDDDIFAAIAQTNGDIKKAAAKGSPAAKRLATALDAALAKGKSVLPALKANLADGIERRLDALRATLSAEPVTLDTLPADLKREWMTPDGRARAEAFPKGDARHNDVLRNFSEAVRSIAPDATGTPISIQESANTVIRAFAVAVALAIVAIAILLFVVLRRPIEIVLVLAPLLLAAVLTFATSVMIGLELNFANIITLPLLLGIGVAFDIYLVVRWRAGQPDLLSSSTARAILFSALTTGTAFGSLALSNVPGNAAMGKLLTIALFYTLVCTFLVLPSLLQTFRPQRIDGVPN